MSTLIDELKQGAIPQLIGEIAKEEGLEQSTLIDDIVGGRVAVPRNIRHETLKPIAIGRGTRVKINANIGTSPNRCDFEDEFEKTKAAIEMGSDTVMDLSISGDISGFRERITGETNVALGTVPIYEAMIGLDSPEDMTMDHFMKVMEKQALEHVDFMTIHAGMLKRHIPEVEKRVLGAVSRGGSILIQWMRRHGKENFLYEHFDEILAMANEYDITMSIGDGLRPGCSADANDNAQFGELEMIGELVQRCREANVQVIVEGPGHVPLHLVEENVRLQKKICKGAPFYLLGPLVIDYAAGYDHIAGAIGAAIAAYHGADFLCYLTPAEHLRLPTIEDVREGVAASVIAAAAADLARDRPAEVKRNLEMSKARNAFDWKTQKKLSVDPAKFDKYLEKIETNGDEDHPCTMCGEWCAIKRARD